MAVNIDKNKCTERGLCPGVSPVGVLKLENGKATLSEDCIDCGACLGVCPQEAINQ